MKSELFIQPDDGSERMIQAIGDARKSIDVAIFRFDHKLIEKALVEAIRRSVTVRALIAFTNRGGESRLRGLESRLLAAGAAVARTADDLTRYHGKFMIIDSKRLFVLGFNFTRADMEQSRSFGLMTTSAELVQEAEKLFNADSTRQSYTSGLDALPVSPVNARRSLSEFLKGAGKELLIYDLEISDRAILQVLKGRAAAGVEVRVIGAVKPAPSGVEVRRSHPLRLHARVIVRDRSSLFVGSQSLRRIELDSRREVGVIFQDRGKAQAIAKEFERDWVSSESDHMATRKIAKKVAKAMAGDLASVGAVLEQMEAKSGHEIDVNRESLDQIVQDAVKTAVRDAVFEAVNAAAVTKD